MTILRELKTVLSLETSHKCILMVAISGKQIDRNSYQNSFWITLTDKTDFYLLLVLLTVSRLSILIALFKHILMSNIFSFISISSPKNKIQKHFWWHFCYKRDNKNKTFPKCHWFVWISKKFKVNYDFLIHFYWQISGKWNQLLLFLWSKLSLKCFQWVL